LAGLVSVVPAGILRLLNWRQLEEKVCGVQSIDLAILECNTEYDDGIGPDDEHIKFFWKTLRTFSDEERSMFLRFVWARPRLPLTPNLELTQKFKIQAAIGDGPCNHPDRYLPKAHTCFFSLNLPRYSSDTVIQVTHMLSTELYSRSWQVSSDMPCVIVWRWMQISNWQMPN